MQEVDFYTIKISNPASKEIVAEINAGKEQIEIDNLNWYEDELKKEKEKYVFVILGGDKVSWEKGLAGIAKIHGSPYAKGYDTNPKKENNFKLKIDMLISLKSPIKREEFIYYPGSFDAGGGIGPATKGVPNQAINALTENQAITILRAMLDKDRFLEEEMDAIFHENLLTKAKKEMDLLLPKKMSYSPGEFCKIIKNDQVEERVNNSLSDEFLKLDLNKIIVGAPGTGKSYKLDEESKRFGNFKERVTFHPSYSYAQFVGTYKPVTDDNEKSITYAYVPGPFIRVLVQALKNPISPYLLIIEEINRANVSSVFGDIFQLLDRAENGESEYHIAVSEDLKAYLKMQGIEKDKIKIPSNMYLWATMNSADQGVFPMDTAFKRRWEFEYISINAGVEKIREFNRNVAGKNVNWNKFREKINGKLIELGINEDKLIGPFFLGLKVLEDDIKFNKAFKGKVLMYLFEDVARHCRSNLFRNQEICSTYSKLCETYDKEGVDIFDDNFLEFEDSDNVNELVDAEVQLTE